MGLAEVNTVRGGIAGSAPTPAFVDVVTKDGVEQSVPAEWVGDPIFDKGWTVVDPGEQETSEAPAEVAASEVALVAGTETEGSLIPAVREAEAEHAAAVAEAAAAPPPTEDDTHAVIDAYAEAKHIDLGTAANGTKAEKVAAITAALDEADTNEQDGNGSPADHPHSGEENQS